MDVPVALIKLRDYALWFGPAYLLALVLGTTSEVIVRRLLRLSSAAESPASPASSRFPKPSESHGAFVSSDDAQERKNSPRLPRTLWSLMIGRMFPGGILPFRLLLWLELISTSITWLALVMTGALSWPLSLLRIGSTFIICAVLAAIVPIINPKVEDGVVALGREQTDSQPPGNALHKQWWRTFSRRLDATSNSAILGAVLGAAVIGLSPRIYSLLAGALQPPPSYIWGPLVGSISLLIPGTDGPLLAAMQAKGLESAAIACMLAVSLAPFGLLRRLRRSYGWRVAVTYALAAWLLASIGGWLLSSTIGSFNS